MGSSDGRGFGRADVDAMRGTISVNHPIDLPITSEPVSTTHVPALPVGTIREVRQRGRTFLTATVRCHIWVQALIRWVETRSPMQQGWARRRCSDSRDFNPDNT